ncbi:MAG: hypothetical protein ACT4OC_18025 [Bradyrhizobium sp.]
MVATSFLERIESFRRGRRQPLTPIMATRHSFPREKTEEIQALLRAIWANPRSAGKMPGSGVTSRTGMGDNLPEIVV